MSKRGNVLVVEDPKLFQAAREAAIRLDIPVMVGPGSRLMNFYPTHVECKFCNATASLRSKQLALYHEPGCPARALLERLSEMDAGARVSRRERRRLRAEYEGLVSSVERAEAAEHN